MASSPGDGQYFATMIPGDVARNVAQQNQAYAQNAAQYQQALQAAQAMQAQGLGLASSGAFHLYADGSATDGYGNFYGAGTLQAKQIAWMVRTGKYTGHPDVRQLYGAFSTMPMGHYVTSTSAVVHGGGAAMTRGVGGAGGSGAIVLQTTGTQGQNMAYEGPPSRSTTPLKVVESQATADLAAIDKLTPAIVDHYGVDAMDKSAMLSNKLLALVGAGNDDEFSGKLSELVMLAKGLDPAESKEKRSILRRILNLFGIAKEQAAEHYRKLDVQVSTLADELGGHSARQSQRIETLESLFGENTTSYNEVKQLVLKGREFLAKPRAKIAEVADGMEAQALADQEAMAERLDKRIADLDVAMTLMLQTAPEIRIMQANARALVDKFTTLTKITIPAWKKQFALHILQSEQKRSALVADAVDDATNDAFSKNADLLRANTGQIAKAGQRLLLDTSTVQHVQDQIVATIADVRQIAQESHKMRLEAVEQLADMREKLKTEATGVRAIEDQNTAVPFRIAPWITKIPPQRSGVPKLKQLEQE